MGEFERREHVALGKAGRLLADALRADLARLDPLLEGRNGLPSRLHVIVERQLGLFNASLCHDRISLGISNESEDRSCSENLPHLAPISLRTICLVSAAVFDFAAPAFMFEAVFFI